MDRFVTHFFLLEEGCYSWGLVCLARGNIEIGSECHKVVLVIVPCFSYLFLIKCILVNLYDFCKRGLADETIIAGRTENT